MCCLAQEVKAPVPSPEQAGVMEEFRREVESIHTVTGYLLNISRGDQKSAVAESMASSELRALRSENEVSHTGHTVVSHDVTWCHMICSA